MPNITVTFDPSNAFYTSDLSDAVGVTPQAALNWIKRRLGKDAAIPAPLFTLNVKNGEMMIWAAADGKRLIKEYKRSRAERV